MHRALKIPEVLEQVFAPLRPAEALACATVCKDWHDNALNALYAHLSGVQKLFKLLGPMQLKSWPKQMHFIPGTKNLRRRNWKTFTFYARRVRRLVLTNDVDGQALDLVRSSFPPSPLFPNIKHIYFTSICLDPEWAPHAALFLHRGIKSINFHDDRGSLANLFDEIVARSPLITEINVDVEPSSIPFRGASVWLNLVLRLTVLTHISVPAHFYEAELVKGLASCPNLESMLSPVTGHNIQSPVAAFVNVGGFEALQHLCLSLDFNSARAVLRSKFPSAQLRSLEIRSWEPEENGAMERLIATIAQRCPLLTKLEISDEGAPPAPETSLLFSALRPLLACHEISDLSIAIPAALSITDQDVRDLCAHLPLLRTCDLNVQFGWLSQFEGGMTLDALSTFAESCPMLERLGIYLCGSGSLDTSRGIRFHHLSELGLRFTHEETNVSSHDVAKFIGEMIPPFCAIDWYLPSEIDMEGGVPEYLLPDNYEGALRLDAVRREMITMFPLRTQLRVSI